MRSAGGGTFSIRDLRVFGTSCARAPAEVKLFSATRDTADDRGATINWKKVPGATGHVVRFGLSPARLYANYQVGDTTALTINALNSGVRHYFTVDAIGEGGVTKGSNTTP